MRYLFDLEWITTDSSESFASSVMVIAEPTRTANIDPNVSTWTPRGKLPPRYVPARETSIASCTPSFCSISWRRDSRAVVSTMAWAPGRPTWNGRGIKPFRLESQGENRQSPRSNSCIARATSTASAPLSTRAMLFVRHARTRDAEADRLVGRPLDVQERLRHRGHERLGVERLPLDHRADCDGGIDIRALQEPLDREGDLEYARHADDGRHADVAFVRPRKGFLHHEVSDLAVELRGDDREPHVRVTLSGPASANPSR